jgi:tetratricopeptide (TPR) repeat protein
MKKPFLSPIALALVLLSGLLLAAAPVRNVEGCLREGNAAFERGDYAAAIALYEKAETISTDPGQVAFNLAVARYGLAQEKKESSATGLREAEMLFRCCLNPKNPRHARALYGLGLCLLYKAAGPEDLNQAGDCFQRCGQAAGDDAELRTAARQGQELVRLHLAQFQPPPHDGDKPPNREPSNAEKPEPRTRPAQGVDPAQQGSDRTGANSNGGEGVQVKPEPGQTPQATQERSPGQGNLPPVPDRADLPPLSPQDASGHLDQASRRILEEQRAYRQRKARPSPQGIRDW